MRSRYCAVVWEQTPLLRRASGALLQVGGGGLLVSLACDVNPCLVPAGLGREPVAIPPGHDAVVFLDPELLIGLPDWQRTTLLQRLAGSAATLVVFANDRGLRRCGSLTAPAQAVGIAVAAGSDDRVSAFAEIAGRGRQPLRDNALTGFADGQALLRKGT
jgi:hypothetical protein